MALQFPPGRYLGKIKNQGYGKTKGEDDQFWVQFDVLGKIDPGNPDGQLIGCETGERSAYFTLKSDKNAEFFIKDMKRLGAPMTSFGQLDPGNSNFHDFSTKAEDGSGSGLETEFICEENNFKGKQSERWKLGGGGNAPVAVPLDAKEARRLDALFGKALKGGDGASLKPIGRSVAPRENIADKANRELLAAGASNRDSDIPF